MEKKKKTTAKKFNARVPEDLKEPISAFLKENREEMFTVSVKNLTFPYRF